MDIAQFVIVAGVSALDIGLGVAVLERNDRSRSHQLFAAAALSIAAWMILSFMSDQPALYARTILLNRLAMAAGVASGISLAAFAVAFPDTRGHLSWRWAVALAPGVFFASASLFGTLVMRGVKVESWGTSVIMGPLYPALIAWAAACLAGLAWTSVTRFRSASALMRRQYTYLYLGLGAFWFAAIVIEGATPILTGHNTLSRYMPIASLLFLVPTAYAMMKHRLLDISSVVLRASTYTMIVGVAGATMLIAADLGKEHISKWLHLDSRAVLFVLGLATLVGFQPVRSWIEKKSDAYLYRRSYDPDKLLADVGRAVAAMLELKPFAERIADLIACEMKLVSASVAYRCLDETAVASKGPVAPDDELCALTELLGDEAVVLADELAVDSKLGSAMDAAHVRVAIRLALDGGTLGAILLGPKKSGALYNANDLRVLEIAASESAIALNNAQLFDDKNERVRELSALSHLATAIGANIGLRTLLQNALEGVSEATSADSGSIMLYEADGETLSVAAAIGSTSATERDLRLRTDEGLASQVAASRKALIVIHGDNGLAAEIASDATPSTITAPVVHKETVIGVINLNRRAGRIPFSEEYLNVVSSFAGQLAVAIENARLYEHLEKTFIGTVSALIAAVDAKDPYTCGHSTEVTEQAVLIAEQLKLSQTDVDNIRLAAMLHDIGKIGINGAILHKPGPLTAEEREIINRHPTIAADILAPLEFLSDVVPLILFHHERPDGTGYPKGIPGSEIPLGARIIAVADSYNAMVSDRPYRQGLSAATARDELKANSGTQFDPDIVDAFLEVLAGDKRPVTRS